MTIQEEYHQIYNFEAALENARQYCLSEMGKTDSNSEALIHLLTLCREYEGVENAFIDIDHRLLDLEYEAEACKQQVYELESINYDLEAEIRDLNNYTEGMKEAISK